MRGRISYLNTDLDLRSTDDFWPLVAALGARGLYHLHPREHTDDGRRLVFETHECHRDPETTITKMLDAIESLDGPARDLWLGCSLREFNLGYDCGDEPWAFNQSLSAQLVGRVAAAGASLRITIYPDHEEGGTRRKP